MKKVHDLHGPYSNSVLVGNSELDFSKEGPFGASMKLQFTEVDVPVAQKLDHFSQCLDFLYKMHNPTQLPLF